MHEREEFILDNNNTDSLNYVSTVNRNPQKSFFITDRVLRQPKSYGSSGGMIITYMLDGEELSVRPMALVKLLTYISCMCVLLI